MGGVSLLCDRGPKQVLSREKAVLSLTDVAVLDDVEPAACGPLMAILAKEQPLPKQLKHLKRVKRKGKEEEKEEEEDEGDKGKQGLLQLLLGIPPLQDKLLDRIAEVLKGSGSGSGSGSGGGGGEAAMHVTHVGVPAEAPEDKKQTDEWSVVWPVVYKIPAGKKATHRAEIPLSLEEKNTMARHLSAAWKLANENQARGLECNGAVVVDPEKDVVVAVGKDETTTWGEEKNKRNPLRHATMVAIGEVAKGILERFPDAGKLPQAKRHCLENAGNTGNGNEEATGPAASTLPLSSAPRCIKEEEPYLCTGYDCYLWREPCTMCAMALVHR